MISIKNIKIPFNHVLIQPDPNHTSYQFAGKETGIRSPDYTYDRGHRVDAKHKNFSTTGVVFGVPEQIRFTREAIQKINASIITERDGQNAVADGSLLVKINQLKAAGCRFETENELSVGDHVKFTYQVHLKAEYFDTEEGPMCFIKYDEIFMTTAGKMINGYILVDPQKRETRQEGGATLLDTPSGLVITKLGETYKRSSRWAHGTVIHAGKKIGGYFDFPTYCDDDIDVQAGDVLIYDPRTALAYETINHMELADRKLFLIQRKDILFLQKENAHFESLCTI